MKITCIDAETTGLIDNHITPLDKQPEVIELYMCEVDIETGEIKEELDFLCKPRLPISAEIARITHITQAMVEDKEPFSAHQDDVKRLIESTDVICAHNLSFDKEMINIEFERLGQTIKWPKLLCTVEATVHLKGFRLNLQALHEFLFGKPFPEAHRARTDCEALTRCVLELHKRGEI